MLDIHLIVVQRVFEEFRYGISSIMYSTVHIVNMIYLEISVNLTVTLKD